MEVERQPFKTIDFCHFGLLQGGHLGTNWTNFTGQLQPNFRTSSSASAKLSVE
jgi:hypothetical protein